MQDLNILEIKNIIRLIRDKYRFDPEIFTSSHIYYRLSQIIKKYSFSDPEMFRIHLGHDPAFFEQVLSELLFSESEMFRDPEMWILLRDDIIPSLSQNFEKINILVCLCSRGSEVYSLNLLVKQLKLTHKTTIHFTWITKENLKRILEGSISSNYIEYSIQNSKMVITESAPERFLIQRDHEYFIHPDFLGEFKHWRHDFNQLSGNRDYHLILCRNRLLNFNPDYQNLLLDMFVQNLVKDGIMVLGYKENIEEYINNKKALDPWNEPEKIFKKVTF